MKRHVLTGILFAVLLCCLTPKAFADQSGTCGDDLTWSLKENAGILTITGTGTMTDFESVHDSTSNLSPFYSLRDSIRTVIIEDGVTSIGSSAFQYCSEMKSVTIPDSVSDIGYGAFYYCSSLTSVRIPRGVTRLGEVIFTGCTRLAEVSIPDSVTSIGIGTFSHCEALKSVTLPESLTRIGSNAFYYCIRLENITIPVSVTSIEEGAFSSSGLTSITIPENVTVIEDIVFSDCSKLASVMIRGPITSIGKGAFQSNTVLRNVYFFGGEAAWKAVSIGKNNEKLTNATMHFVDPENDWLLSYDANGGKNAPAAQNQHKGESLTLSSAAPKLDGWNFLGWSSDSAAAEPDCQPGDVYTAQENVTLYAVWGTGGSFDNSLFWSLKRDAGILTISGTGQISSVPWYDLRSLVKTLVIEDGVTRIAQHTFYAHTNLTYATIADSVTFVEPMAFSSCNKLTKIELPHRITSIQDGTFYDCRRLIDITIPDSVTNIGMSAFSGCSSLTDVTIPGSVVSIGNQAFYNCTALHDVYYLGTEDMWDSVSIGTDNSTLSASTIHCELCTLRYDPNGGDHAPAEQISRKGETAELSTTTPRRTDWFFRGWSTDNGATEPLFIPGDLVTVQADLTLYAVWFQPDGNCPANLQTVEEESFAGSAFTFIALTENTESIGPRAFSNCPLLKYIYIPAGTTSIDDTAFAGVNDLVVFGVSGSYAASYAMQQGFTFRAVD